MTEEVPLLPGLNVPKRTPSRAKTPQQGNETRAIRKAKGSNKSREPQAARKADGSPQNVSDLDVAVTRKGTRVWMQQGGQRVDGRVVDIETEKRAGQGGADNTVTIEWTTGRQWRVRACHDCCRTGTTVVHTGPSTQRWTRLTRCLHCNGRGMHIQTGKSRKQQH